MGKRTFGTFFELGGRGAMEALGHTGLDYVIIDTEHGPFSEESVADLILAAEACGLVPYVRIGDTRRPYVLRMLDIGARGLIIPNIRSVAQVREVVDAAKFPPIGHRGFCPNRTSGWGTQKWAIEPISYMAEANMRCKIIPQCETVEALEAIEDICAIEGVDGIFVGPFDLSVDLGIPLQMDNPVLVEGIHTVLDACKHFGKESFLFSATVEGAASWAAAGFDSITYSLDANVFISAYQDIVAQLHNAVKE